MLNDAAKTIQQFLEGFVAPAYDENVVPEDAPFPRITYAYSEDDLDNPVMIPVSLWDMSYSWTRITALAGSIRNNIPQGGLLIPYQDGKIWLKRGEPFIQRMGDPNDAIRRIYINIEAEFLTAS